MEPILIEVAMRHLATGEVCTPAIAVPHQFADHPQAAAAYAVGFLMGRGKGTCEYLGWRRKGATAYQAFDPPVTEPSLAESPSSEGRAAGAPSHAG